MKQALTKLLKIKSIVTVLLTISFVTAAFIQQVKNEGIPEPLVNIYLMVIGFYFGTVFEKKSDEENKDGE